MLRKLPQSATPVIGFTHDVPTRRRHEARAGNRALLTDAHKRFCRSAGDGISQAHDRCRSDPDLPSTIHSSGRTGVFAQRGVASFEIARGQLARGSALNTFQLEYNTVPFHWIHEPPGVINATLR